MELGIGRGDSSRRVMGKKPVSWSQLEAAVKEFRDLTSGKEVEHDGQPTRLTWAQDSAARLDRGLWAESSCTWPDALPTESFSVCRSRVD